MKKKFNLSTATIIIICLISIIFLNIKQINYDQIKNRAFNIINAELVGFNQIYGSFGYQNPNNYNITNLENQVQLTTIDATILIHFGTNKIIPESFYRELNPNLVLNYSFENEDGTLFFIWEFDESQKLILIGKNDRFIEGLVPNDKLENYVIEIATIFGSITEIKGELHV